MMSILSRLTKNVSRFKRDQSGIAASEFAIILPTMIALCFGAWEISNAYLVKKRADHAAATMADLVTQADSISQQGFNGIMEAVDSIMYPYEDHTQNLHLIGVNVDNRGRATVAWQFTKNGGTGLSAASLPSGLVVPNSFYVIAATRIAYEPIFGAEVTGSINLEDQAIMVPRLTTSIARTN
jgi:Flp pilus assembly protein TadG